MPCGLWLTLKECKKSIQGKNIRELKPDVKCWGFKTMLEMEKEYNDIKTVLEPLFKVKEIG